MTRGWAKRALTGAGLTRRRVATARMCCERSAIAVLNRGRSRPRSGGRILTYHAVGTPYWAFNDITPQRFRRHLELALEQGYRFVHPDDIARSGGADRDLAVTFDDGVTSVLEHAAPILRELHIPWTIFVVSDWAEQGHPAVAEGTLLNWRQVEEVARFGGTIGSHSVTHPNFGQITPEHAAQELFDSREAIQRRTGIDAKTFAIPFGQSRDWTAEAGAAARAAGYEIVYAQSESRRFPGTVPRTKLARTDMDFIFRAALRGAFEGWEEWY